MRVKKFSLTCLSLLALTAMTLPVFSCSLNMDANNQLTVIGPNKIYIDQSASNIIAGKTSETWSVKKGEQTLDNNNICFELIDCDDNNIVFNDSCIHWNNPTLVDHTFRIKASYVEESTSKQIYGISDQITLLADPSSTKVEFVNEECSFPYNITAQAGTAGQQDGKWIFKLNNSPYPSQKSSLKIVDANGIEIKGISINNNGQISWDKSLVYGTYNLYLSANIEDNQTGQIYNVRSSNKPIVLTVEKASIYLEDHEKIAVSIETKTVNEIARYHLLNSKGVDITTDPSVMWSLEKAEGSADFGDNIRIQNGIVSTTTNLPKGHYKFNAVARKSGLSLPVISKDIEVTSQIPYIVKGVNNNIIAFNYSEIKQTVDFANYWSLCWNDDKMKDVAFSIVPISDDPTEIQCTELLKASVKIHKIDAYNVCLEWDGKLEGGYYNFKLQGKYDNETILSESITLKSMYEYNSYININGGLKDITAICCRIPVIETHNGKLSNAFTVKQKDYSINIDWNKLKWSFLNTQGVDFKLEIDKDDPTKAYLVWDNLKTLQFGQIGWKTIYPKLVVRYAIENQTLIDSFSFNFTVGNFASKNNDVFFADGKSYNFNQIINPNIEKGMGPGEPHPGDTLYFDSTPTSNPSVMQQSLFEIPWSETEIIDSEFEVAKVKMLQTTSKNHRQRAQFQRFGLQYRLPTKTQISFKLYCKSCFWAGSSFGLKFGRYFARRMDIYNLNTRVLPQAIHPYTTIDNPKTNNTPLQDCPRYHVEDSLCHGSKDRLDHVHTFNHDQDLIYEFKPINIVLTNITNYTQDLFYYIGLSGITTQGNEITGPDTNLSLESEFWITDQIIKGL